MQQNFIILMLLGGLFFNSCYDSDKSDSSKQNDSPADSDGEGRFESDTDTVLNVDSNAVFVAADETDSYSDTESCLTGDIKVVTPADIEAVALGQATCIEGNLDIQTTEINRLFLERLESIGEKLSIQQNSILAVIEFPALTQVKDISIYSNHDLSASFSSLKTVGSLEVSGNSSTNVDLSALERAEEIHMPGNYDSIEVYLDSLTTVERGGHPRCFRQRGGGTLFGFP